MNKSRHFCLLALAALIVLSDAGCEKLATEPTTPVAPISIGGDLFQIDVCKAIPREGMEALMGRHLVSEPKRFEYYDTKGTAGCSYEAGKDSANTAYFSYVAFTPVEVFENQPLHMNVDVSGIGQKAYFNNGADARQLWVKVNDRVAFVVANGDVAYEDGEKALAKLIIAAIK